MSARESWLALVLLAAAPLVAQPARIEFTLPLDEAHGGGSVAGTAGTLDYLPEGAAELAGGVELRFRDVVVRAERMVVDPSTSQLVAEGNVILDQGPNRVTGARIDWDLETKTGRLSEATASLASDIYFQGAEVARVGEGLWEIRDGIFTSCEGETPSWSFQVGVARIEEQAYAHVRSATMRAKALPVLYFPYLLWPTKTDRSSGLLVPKIGYSDQRGNYLGLAWYKVLGRSADATVYADLYTEEYYGGGLELRWRPTENTTGEIRGFAIRDPLDEDWRWKLELDHQTRDLPWGLRGVAHIEDYSDFEYFRDFERGLAGKTQRQLYSDAYLTKNSGPHSFNLLVDRRETFLSNGRVVTLEQFPEIEYDLRKTRLGNLPVFLELDAAAHALSVDRNESYRGDYTRAHLRPQLTVAALSLPWLGVSFSGGADATWWSDGLTTLPGGGSTFSGEELTRFVPIAGAEVVGPSFSRIYEGDDEGFGRFKHIVEPRLSWSYGGDFDDEALVPVFDTIDSTLSTNIGRVSLVNRLLAKPADPDAGGAREVLSFELARRYSFDDELALESGTIDVLQADGTVLPTFESSQAGPLEAVLRAYPSERFGLRVRADYSLLFSELTTLQVSGDFKVGRSRLSLTWTPSWRATNGETLSNQTSFGIATPLGKRLQLRSSVTYDFEESLVRDQRHFITWLGDCYSLRLELHESRTLFEQRTDYLFSIDLKNVGTFLDINGGESSEAP